VTSLAATSETGVKHKLPSIQEKLDIVHKVEAISSVPWEKKSNKTFAFLCTLAIRDMVFSLVND
jgi:hypothetical protein